MGVKLACQEHLNMVLTKVYKSIGLLSKLHNSLSTAVLVKIFESFIETQLDYGDVFYDQVFHSFSNFKKKLNPVKCSSSLAIMQAIIGTSRDKLYQALGLGSLSTMFLA